MWSGSDQLLPDEIHQVTADRMIDLPLGLEGRDGPSVEHVPFDRTVLEDGALLLR